jgi:DNA-binding NarL/FixJ family response regulator
MELVILLVFAGCCLIPFSCAVALSYANAPKRPKQTAEAITVLLADNSAINRIAIRRLLDSSAEVKVIVETINHADAGQLANDLKPQVIVMNLQLLDGKVTPARVRSLLEGSKARLLAISNSDSEAKKWLAESYGAVE